MNRQEMEFLGINLAKDSSLLLHAIYSFFYCLAYFTEYQTLQYSGCKIYTKNLRNKKTRDYSWVAFCRKEIYGKKLDKSSILCPETSSKISV